MVALENFGNSPEFALANKFSEIVLEMFDGSVPLVIVAGACATLLSSSLVCLPPADRVLVLSETVDAILQAFNNHPVTDLLN